jgi:hypothetical protein
MEWSYDSEKSRELFLGLSVHEKAIFRVWIAYAFGLTGGSTDVAAAKSRVNRNTCSL